ncbi:MAG: hypothetical protein HYT37_04350 [Candidatus Sungbacteria bacterium]|nr:hypothetical protein [Candidatus Sungbacteria bacterium]
MLSDALFLMGLAPTVLIIILLLSVLFSKQVREVDVTPEDFLNVMPIISSAIVFFLGAAVARFLGW